jgi:hypothetical protein
VAKQWSEFTREEKSSACSGGYILTLSSSIDRCNPANLQAIIHAAKEYGVYLPEPIRKRCF